MSRQAPSIPSEEQKSKITRRAVDFRFRDIDMFGHLNNVVYLELFDVGKAEFLMQFTDGKFSPKEVNMVIVHIEADYYAQTFPDEQLDVITALVGIGERSLKFEQWVVNRHNDEIKCHGKTILAHIDLVTGQSTPIPPDLTAKCQKLLL